MGDALTVLRTLPTESVHCAVTSPPYYGLRDYGVAGQIGLEQTPDEYIARLVEVFAELWRVLRPDATLWLNIGDSYASTNAPGRAANKVQNIPDGGRGYSGIDLNYSDSPRLTIPPGYKPKDLLLIPFRLAIALQADGWYVRSDIAWCKKSCMPESVQDRPTSAWEHVFQLSKQPRYFYDADAVREEGTWNGQTGPTPYQAPGQPAQTSLRTIEPGSRNQRNFWLLGPEPYSAAHFATFVPEIPRRAILAGTSERGVCPECGAPWMRESTVEQVPDHSGGAVSARQFIADPRDSGKVRGWAEQRTRRESITTGWRPSCAHPGEPVPANVLDPFFGAGTTGLVADRLNRDCIGIELNPAYAELALRRIAGESPMFSEVSVA